MLKGKCREGRSVEGPQKGSHNSQSLNTATQFPPLSDASRNQCAIFLNYDIPSEGNAEANISTSDGNQRFFGAISSSTVPEQPVCECFEYCS